MNDRKIKKLENYREWLKLCLNEINNNGQHKELCLKLLKEEKMFFNKQKQPLE
jgi:hypothetical protein